MTYGIEGKRIWIAGHRGLVGAALMRRLAREDCALVTVGREVLDLTRQAAVEDWLAEARPHAVVLAAARVGGIQANRSRPADFLHDNLAIQLNVIEAARKVGVEKLLFLGSSCIYPRLAPQPIAEDSLLTGPLEPTNEWYAVAKIAGLKLCQACRRQHGCDFVTVVPANLYGPGDNWDPEAGHVVSGLLARAHAAKLAGAETLAVWGSGRPRREFLYVEDLADALVFLLRNYSDDLPINVGSGEAVSIAELARLVCETVGFGGRLDFDRSRPDGMPRKQLDIARQRALGWQAATSLRDGLAATYRWYLDNVAGDAAAHVGAASD